ncbi:MAG: tetratricopeptide repeat protein [Bacteroidota bacterium]|nr:tetratricopeptide repeat protein [Bacteroidota bacterium]MDP4196117.1 tetratricopeptide repeat protein [Bacteroidota bacterium]
MKYIYLILLVLSMGSFQASFSQNSSDQQKREAIVHIRNGRFGEAIEMLNKYIAANPRNADGYNLRALCYEKRGQNSDAVLDLRRALKLAPNNREIQQNLARVEKTQNSSLNKKIEGHKREIAINPKAGVNYLEIGKSMKDMGNWQEAEKWYDEYLKREDASPDEIIRYCEILGQNNHLVKGEKILKTYTQRYPNDQRLWSRYGFFTMWLGKNKLAIQAFEKALAIKPFFEEAQEGLNQAKGKPYIFEWTDTTRSKKGHGKVQKPVQEFAIDKYYRLLKSKPDDNETRVLLVNELMKNERAEEAYQQAQILTKSNADNESYRALFDSVISFRTNLYKEKAQQYSDQLAKKPNDKELVKKLASIYSNLGDYENAQGVLEKYLSNVSENEALDVRFLYAKILAWNREFEKALDPMNLLLKKDPENLEYQLLRGQIAVWTDQDFDLAEKYLKNVSSKQPENIDPIIALGSLYIKRKEMDTAKVYLEQAKAMNPEHPNVKELQIYYDFRVLAMEETKIFEILVEGRNLALEKNYTASLEKYNEYLSKTPSPSRLVLAEYADVNACAKNFSKSIEVYDQLLSQEYDFDLALMRAKTILWGADSTVALTELKKLYKEQPDNFDVQIYLAESYEKMHEYGESKDILENLLSKTTDSTKIALVQQRIKWLPVSGLYGFLSSFPNYIGIFPQYAYYWDNMGFQLNSTTGSLDLGLTSFLTLGASFSRGTLQGDYEYYSVKKNFTTFKGQVYLRPIDRLTLNCGLGNLTYQGMKNRSIMDAGIKYENEKVYQLSGTYEKTDAGLMLYSPYLVNLMDRGQGQNQYRITADRLKFSGYYNSSLGMKFSGYFSYLKLTDGNAGNDFQLRIARNFIPELFVGYEYNFINYARSLSLKLNRDFYYYSPHNFESHSIWAEWNLNKAEDFSLNIGGKVGYVPASDYILREISGNVSYKPFKYLTISGIITAGGTYRDDSAYNYLSTYISAYLSF